MSGGVDKIDVMDYYQVLGVHRDASAHAIKQAYRRLAFQYHPDRNPKDPKGAQQRMQVLNEAYDTLSDAQKRRDYDFRYTSYSAQKDSEKKSEPKQKPIDPEAQRMADEIVRDFEERLASETGRFESKDGIFAVVLAFLGVCNWQAQGDKLTATLGLVGACLVAGMLARSVVRAGYRDFTHRNPDSFLSIILSNVTAAIVMVSLAKSMGDKWSLALFAFPPQLTVLSVLFPSVVGAAFGRAFNGGLGAIAGIISSWVIGGVIAFFTAVWLLFFQLADERMTEAATKTSFTITVLCTLIASGIGSMRLQSFSFFSVLDLFENFFERFSRKPASRALVIKD